MRIKREDLLSMMIVIAMIVITSCMVEEPRLITPPEKSIVEVQAEEITRKTEAARKEQIRTILAEALEEPEEEIEEVYEAPAIEEVIEEEYEIERANDYEDQYEESYEVERAYEQGLSYIGDFEITAYEWTGYPCANGCYPTEGYTIACNSLPIGTEVYIEGVGYRTVEDRGATWHSDNWIDLYLGDVGACYEWGIQYREVYLVG